jgi:hypothetical protein
MNKELAKTLTTALVQFIDEHRPEGTMCCSNTECEKIRAAFEEESEYDCIETFIRKKLSRLTEFEDKLVSFALQCGGQLDTANEEAKKWSNEFLSLARRELLSYPDESNPAIEAMADLERAVTCCNADNIPKWLTEELNKAFKKGQELSHEDYIRGYDNGYKDAEKWYNNRVASRSPIMPTPLSGWGCDGTHCTNPQMDCINCPRKNIGGGFNMQSGTSTLKAEG